MRWQRGPMPQVRPGLNGLGNAAHVHSAPMPQVCPAPMRWQRGPRAPSLSPAR